MRNGLKDVTNSFNRVDGSRSHETADADVFLHLASSIVRRNKKMQRFDDISCYFKSDNGGVENGAQWKHRYKVNVCVEYN